MKFIYATRIATGQVFCIPESDLIEYPETFSPIVQEVPVEPVVLEEPKVKDVVAHEVIKHTRSKKAKPL